jgi:ABC-type phosphate/phosphonate transport system substrate-binding protein
MIASFPMYLSHPAGNTALWQYLAAALRQSGAAAAADIPEALYLPGNAKLTEHWLQPDLLLSQVCGYQMVDALEHRVQLVGAMQYTADGCTGMHYSSFLVCRADDAGQTLGDFRHRVATYNSTDSQSGYHSLRAMVAPMATAGRFFARAIESGGHIHSLALVRSCEADLAAIDCISYAQFQRFQPEVLYDIRILGRTASAPGTALITSLETPPALLAALRTSLHQAMAAPALAATRAALLLGGFEEAAPGVFEVLRTREKEATACGLVGL